MIEFLLATTLDCEGSQELVERIMKSQQSTIDKHELIDKVSVSQGVDRDSIIEVIKTNTEPGCYEGSEHNS